MYVCVLVCVHQLCSHCSTTRIYTHRYPCPSPSISPLSTSIEVLSLQENKSSTRASTIVKEEQVGKFTKRYRRKGEGKGLKKGWCTVLLAKLCGGNLLSPRFSSAQQANGKTGKEVQLSFSPLNYPPSIPSPKFISIFV